MPYALYVCLQDDNKIAAFAIDPENGQLSSQAEVPLAGGPSVMALSPDQQKVYVGTRSEPAISTYQIDQGTGRLTCRAVRQPSTRRPSSHRIAPASTCYRPTTRADRWRCIQSRRMGRSVLSR